MTNNIAQRLTQHREGIGSAFTRRYRIHKLVYFETFDFPLEAIMREKQIKAGSRKKKIMLIESINPSWIDLSDQIG
jgi:putative endonuclease